jgi:hypothetical protein
MPLQRNQLGKNLIGRDTRNLRTRLNIQSLTAGQTTDHGSLLGLADDDHANYVHLSAARTITGQHSFSPSSTQAPFVLGANAQSQVVTGLRADELNKTLTAGDGLSGGGLLSADRTIDMETPNTLSVTSTNTVGTGHSHAITTSDNPQENDQILATDVAGRLNLFALSVGNAYTSSNTPLHIEGTTTPQMKMYYTTGQGHYWTVDGTGQNVMELQGSVGGLTIQGDGSINLNPDGDIVLDPGGDDILPLTTYDLNIGSINKKYLTIHAAELWVSTLVSQEVVATIGGRVMVAPSTILEADLSSTNEVVNPGFENRTGNNFDNWTETVGDGSITAQTSDPFLGSSYVRVTAGASSNTQIVSDAITVVPGTEYFFEIRYKSSTTGNGTWVIYDISNTTNIKTLTVAVNKSAWTYSWGAFCVPTGCTSIEIRLVDTPNNGQWTEWDSLRLYESQVTLKHNQPDDNDTLLLESFGKVEGIKVNDFAIQDVDQATDYFEIGTSQIQDGSPIFTAGLLFQVRGSTGNDGTYTVASATWTGTATRVFVDEEIPSATADGYIAYTMDDLAGPYTYHRCQRDRSATGLNDWYIGDTVVNTGIAGDGYIDLYSVSSMHTRAGSSSQAWGPTIAGMVRDNDSGLVNVSEAWAIGNLNGLYGQSQDNYGAAFGSYATGYNNIVIDGTTAGIVFRDYQTVLATWIEDDITLGKAGDKQVYISPDNLLITNNSGDYIRVTIGSGLEFFANSVRRGQLAPTGNFWFGDTGATERIHWDTSGGLRIYNASNVAVVQFPISGAAKLVGTLNVSGSGELTLGASPDVTLNASGLTFAQTGAEAAAKSVNFDSPSGTGLRVSNYQKTSDTTNYGYFIVKPHTAYRSYAIITSQSYSGYDARVLLNAVHNSTESATLDVFADGSAQWVAADPTLTVGARQAATSGFDLDVQGGGKVYVDDSIWINETTNAHSGARAINIKADGTVADIITIKDPDVVHVWTNHVESDTIFALRKYDDGSTGGGIAMTGLNEATRGFVLEGYGMVPITTEATSSYGYLVLRGGTDFSNGYTNGGNDDNIIVFQNYGTTRMIMKGDGEVYNDYHSTNSMGTNYDDYNDVQLLRAFDTKTAGLELGESWFQKNLDKLAELRIVTPYDDGNGMFVSQQKMTKLQIGAIWQLYEKVEQLQKELSELQRTN